MTNSTDSTPAEPEGHDDKLMRLKLKSEPVKLAEASLVSKSFALKFLRKAIVAARIQVLKDPPQVVREKYRMAEFPGHEVWQVWAGTKKALVEVFGPKEVLPFVAVRETFRCIMHMDVRAMPLKGGGVRLIAEELPKPSPHEGHGETEGAPCECFGTDKHEECAKTCAVCKGKDATEARKLRGEAIQIIDARADEELKKQLPELVEGVTPVDGDE